MKYLLITVLLLLSTLALAQDEEVDHAILCENIESCGISYVRLANQTSDPFLFYGKLMNEDNPRWHQYQSALRKYPEVRDCLIEAEKDKAEPNLLLMDWRQTGTGRGADVCIFLIARSLGSIKRHEQWLMFHNFRSLIYSRHRSEDFSPSYETQPVSYLSGTWTVGQYRATNPSWFVSLTGLETVQGYSVIIRYSEQQLVVGVSASTRSK